MVILDDKLIGGFPLVGLVIFGVRKHKDFMNYYLMDSSCDDIYGDMEVELRVQIYQLGTYDLTTNYKAIQIFIRNQNIHSTITQI